MENWLVSSVEEVFKSMQKLSNVYTTTITFATSIISTPCSKPSGVLCVTHFFQRRWIWNVFWILLVIVLNKYTQRMFTNWEKRFLKSWVHSMSYIEMSKNGLRTWRYLNLSPFVSRKQTHTRKLKRGSGSMCLYQFLFRQIWSRAHISLQRQFSSSHIVFYHCSRRISNSKQSSDETELYWSRNCNQDKTVCYTGTTQPKMQSSREGVKFF